MSRENSTYSRCSLFAMWFFCFVLFLAFFFGFRYGVSQFVVVILEVSACSLWSVAPLVVSEPSLKQNTMVTGACVA